MPRNSEQPVGFDRLLELATQADRQDRCRFTPFLTPPEAELALAAGKRAGVEVALDGGYADAERCMARYCASFTTPEAFPLTALLITWPHQQVPEHRDILGALMGLGIQRARAGDIVMLADQAYAFVESALASVVESGLTEAGRIRLHTQVVESPEALDMPTGERQEFTVQTPRLDAIVADGFHLSRSNAAQLISSGAVKLRHVAMMRPDARVEPGDAVSVRGYGRLRIEGFGQLTRKGRLPVRILRYGAMRR